MGLIRCEHCAGVGYTNINLRLSPCASCNGIGRLESNWLPLSFEKFSRLLLTRFNQLRAEFTHSLKLISERQRIEPIRLLQTSPLIDSPYLLQERYRFCSECRGIGISIQNHLLTLCPACCSTSLDANTFAGIAAHDKIIVLLHRNRRLKMQLDLLNQTPDIAIALNQLAQQYATS